MDAKYLELFKYLDIDPDFEELGEVKTKFEKTYVKTDTLGDRKDLLKPHFAKTLGGIDTALKRSFKNQGVELAASDLDGKSTVEIIEFAHGKLGDLWTEKEEGLKAQIGKTDDKKYNDLLGNHETLRTDFKTIEGAHSALLEEYEQFKVDTANQALEKDRSRAKNDLWGSVKYADTVKNFSRIGFRTSIENDYSFPFAEDGKTLEVRGKESNEKIPNPNKAGSFYEPAEFLQAQAVKENLWQLSPDQEGAKKQHASTQRRDNPPPQAQNGRPARTLHANAAPQ